MTGCEKMKAGVELFLEGLSEAASKLAYYCIGTAEWYDMSMAYLRGDISGRVYHLYGRRGRARTRKKQVKRMRKAVKKNGRLA